MKVAGILGNVNTDPDLKQRYERLSKTGKVDVLTVSRREALLARFRKRTKGGKDVIVSMERGAVLHHGDVLSPEEPPDEEEMIVVEIAPEEVLTVKVKADVSAEEQVETALKLGYAFGNKHRQVFIEGRTIWTPLEDGKDLIMDAISGIRNLDVRTEKRRLEPLEPSHTH